MFYGFDGKHPVVRPAGMYVGEPAFVIEGVRFGNHCCVGTLTGSGRLP
jgi:hypothetical protein